MVAMEEKKPKITPQRSENFFRAYLPQSLSDNILVSHKSQALQGHSKRQGEGVRATDTQRKGKE